MEVSVEKKLPCRTAALRSADRCGVPGPSGRDGRLDGRPSPMTRTFPIPIPRSNIHQYIINMFCNLRGGFRPYPILMVVTARRRSTVYSKPSRPPAGLVWFGQNRRYDHQYFFFGCTRATCVSIRPYFLYISARAVA